MRKRLCHLANAATGPAAHGFDCDTDFHRQAPTGSRVLVPNKQNSCLILQYFPFPCLPSEGNVDKEGRSGPHSARTGKHLETSSKSLSGTIQIQVIDQIVPVTISIQEERRIIPAVETAQKNIHIVSSGGGNTPS